MSLINMFVAARDALAERRQRTGCATEELVALDDRSLADIGIHRSQIPGVVERHVSRASSSTRPRLPFGIWPRRHRAGLSAAGRGCADLIR